MTHLTFYLQSFTAAVWRSRVWGGGWRAGRGSTAPPPPARPRCPAAAGRAGPPSTRPRHTAARPGGRGRQGFILELQTKVREDFTITEKAPTRLNC